MEGERDASCISEFPVQRQALLCQYLCPINLTLVEGYVRSRVERLRPHGRCGSFALRQSALQEDAPLI